MSGPISIDNVPMDYFLRGVEAAQQPQGPGQTQGQGGNGVQAPQSGAKQPAGAGSLVKQLDVLLLQAAKGGAGCLGDKTVKSAGDKLKTAGLLSKEEYKALAQCGAKANKAFKALGNFTGAQLGGAFKVENGRTAWDPDSKVAQACKAAIDAQLDLSEMLSRFGRRAARADNAPEGLDGLLIEMRQICDRRATEVQSLAFQMHEFALYAAGQGEAVDPNIAAILKATTVELLPRQSLAMHGTADVLEGRGAAAQFAESLKPLAARIDAFAANPGAGVDAAELEGIKADIARMRAAVSDVRANGIPSGNGRMMVAKDILRALDTALDNAEKAFGKAKATVAAAIRRNMQETMDGLLDTMTQERLDQITARYPPGAEMLQLCQDFLADLEAYVDEAAKDEHSHQTTLAFARLQISALSLQQAAHKVPAEIAKQVGEDFVRLQGRAKGVGTLIDEFKALSRRMKDAPTERVLTGTEARSVFTGQVSVSNVVEARVRGLRDADVDPATEPGRLVSEDRLGGGNAGEVWELKFAGGETFVFKGETESRGGLVGLQVGIGKAYAADQQATQLSLASKTVADRLGCGKRIVKYSVGSHQGTFGMFMEKAKGMSAKAYRKDGSKAPPGGLSAQQIRGLAEPERKRIRGEIQRQLNQLQWLDAISGQLDRHHDNYFVFVDAETHEVSVQGIDNDASFTTVATGMGKFRLDAQRTGEFVKLAGKLALTLNPNRVEAELEKLLEDEGLTALDDNTIEVDVAKIKTPALLSCLKKATGMQIAAAPAIIDRDMFNALMELKNNPAKKQAFLDDLRDRLSPEALAAQEKRLDDAIAHAEELERQGHVVDADMWGGIEEGARGKGTVKVPNSAGKQVALDDTASHAVRTLLSPSIFHRDQLADVF